jgi:hypothetical protein
MAVELIEIVNDNGRKGLVAATSTAAKAYKTPPSARQPAANEVPGPAEPTGTAAVDPVPPTAPEKPAKNASTKEWVAYATHPDTPNGLSSEAAEQMNRDGEDGLIAHFDTVQED